EMDFQTGVTVPELVRSIQPGVDGGAIAPYILLDEYLNNTTVKTVVQNVQVLAALPKQATEPTNDLTPSETVEPDLIAILAVRPQEVEVIRFAQLDANISLALRSPADYQVGTIDTTGITLYQLVTLYGVLPPYPVTNTP
ncbi:MAG: RcpC/CpaB family pilus assembly protein, partial [Candidatus Limnocylindrales bacterium]